jgi:hypothetical protein
LLQDTNSKQKRSPFIGRSLKVIVFENIILKLNDSNKDYS